MITVAKLIESLERRRAQLGDNTPVMAVMVLPTGERLCSDIIGMESWAPKKGGLARIAIRIPTTPSPVNVEYEPGDEP